MEEILKSIKPAQWRVAILAILLLAVAGLALANMPVPSASSTVTASYKTYPLVISHVTETDQSYILVLKFTPPPLAAIPNWRSGLQEIKIKDADGADVPYHYPELVDFAPVDTSGAELWAIEIEKGFAAPLEITYVNQYFFPAPLSDEFEFQFDAGANPAAGQTWTLNKEIVLSEHQLTLLSISVFQGGSLSGYDFEFATSDPQIAGLNVEIKGYTSAGGGGGTDYNADTLHVDRWSATKLYPNIPAGNLTVILSGLHVYGETKNWTIKWSP